MVKAALVTAPAPVSGTPLGLKYTILKQSGDDMVEVPPDTVFHAGDRVQLSVQTNGPGYLYIILRGIQRHMDADVPFARSCRRQ